MKIKTSFFIQFDLKILSKHKCNYLFVELILLGRELSKINSFFSVTTSKSYTTLTVLYLITNATFLHEAETIDKILNKLLKISKSKSVTMFSIHNFNVNKYLKNEQIN